MGVILMETQYRSINVINAAIELIMIIRASPKYGDARFTPEEARKALIFLYYHTMNPGSTCLGSLWVQSVFVSILLGMGKSCGPI